MQRAIHILYTFFIFFLERARKFTHDGIQKWLDTHYFPLEQDRWIQREKRQSYEECTCLLMLLELLLSRFSCVGLCATPQMEAHQAPPSLGFSRQEYWSGLPFPSPGDLPHPGIEPRSPALQADVLPSEPPGKS